MPKYVVRHGVMRQLGVFSTRGGDRFARGQRVIARTSRGQEAGEVLCEATEHVQSQMAQTSRDGGNDSPKTGQILRLSSGDDDVELRKIDEQANEQIAICQKRAQELGLEMELVDAEQLYGGERVVFYYLAEGRVDFRELVKRLAKEFQIRVEMRQIGVRDEAKLLADYGDCGKPVCCNTHLSEMPPVSMKMAKLQKATLDPTKISGRCGRLKCCLRYEYDTYRDIQKELPRVGAEIITANGKGKVLAQEILASQLLVQTEDMRRMVIDVSDVLSVLPRRPSEAKQPQADNQTAPTKQPSDGKPAANQTNGQEPNTEPAQDSIDPAPPNAGGPEDKPPKPGGKSPKNE